MACPYHPDNAATLPVPPARATSEGWIGWLAGCCGLPVWQCPQGELHPIDADYCRIHGCARPPFRQVLHERLADAPPVTLLQRRLELPPARDGLSAPVLAGNVLAYLTDSGTVVAVDFSPAPIRIDLVSGVRSATLSLRRGSLMGALEVGGRVRYVSWPVTELRHALREGGLAVPSSPVDPCDVHPLALPTRGHRVHHGAGALRLVVEHDPLPEVLAASYTRTTGSEPGEYLIRRPLMPGAVSRPSPHLRPQRLLQMPVPVPGGTLLLGRLRWSGAAVDGALVVPTVRRSRA